MRQIPCLFLFIIVTILSCSKDSHNNSGLKITRESNTEYSLKVARTERKDVSSDFKVITAFAKDGSQPSAIQLIWFVEFPTVSGEYNVIDFNNDRMKLADEMGIVIHFPGRDSLYSTGRALVNADQRPGKAKVTVTNGKISVIIPNMTVKTFNNNVAEYAYISGSVAE